MGVSLPRPETFDSLLLNTRLKDEARQPHVGIAVIDLKTGNCIEWLWLRGDVREIYSVVVMRDVQSPVAFSQDSEQALGLITMER